MSLRELRYGVWLSGRHIGTLNQRGDYTWFAFSEGYLGDYHRPVLGLAFEQDLHASHASALRLTPWFSNLLPEGKLRDWIARDRHVSADREMELLAQVGHDLPGAIQIFPEDGTSADDWDPANSTHGPQQETESAGHGEWRFSLAGVGLKFSMLRQGDRLTLPTHGEGGDWIVKLPDQVYANVPHNEHTMMSLAARVGIETPEIALVHRDKLGDLPEGLWPNGAELAYAVRRFDRSEHRESIHIEDLAQVRDFYPHQKYQGNFETIAALLYRGRDLSALREFTRRLTFNILISNGDAHLKNWSLIYHDQRVPTLAPAYDLVCTAAYRNDESPEDLGLRFGGTRKFERINYGTFDRLEQRLRANGAGLADIVASTVQRTGTAWEECAYLLRGNETIRDTVSASIERHSRTLLRKL